MPAEIVKKVTVKGPKGRKGFAILYDDGSILIEYVRFSHPHIHKPWKKETDKGPPKFSVVSMLGKKTHKKAIELVEERIQQLLDEAKVRSLKSDRKFLRDGDEEGSLPEYEGFMTVSAREEKRPPMRNSNGKRIEIDDVNDDDENLAASLFVGGHWGAVRIRPWYQDSKDWGKRVNSGLSAVQFLLKDETFGKGQLSEEDLDSSFRAHDDDDDDGSYDDDDDDRPRRKKSRARDDDDDDDDDRPRKKRRSRDDDDDDEDERPRRKKRRSRDDDDDDDDDDI